MTDQEIFELHNANVTAGVEGCECEACKRYRNSPSAGPEAKSDPLQQFLSDLDAAIQQMKGQG